MWLVKTENLINLLDETIYILNKYNLDLNDVTVLFKGEVINASDVKEKLNVDYDNSWGHCNFEEIQLIIDDYTWFERTSYDGYEKYILKAHPLLSNFKNQESHSENFLRGFHGN
ncbi:MAG: hypothetical protein IK044_00545 [Methanobrevibacter sp.]|nr:hypothetical protein [bacterium]MBR6023437.1 hypothetical protein [Methanobrevibacter sp.]